MSRKGIEKKFNRLIENSDPIELENKIVKYTNEAFDDVILNGNQEDGLQKIRTSVKFLRDHKYYQPNTFINAWKKINEHLVEILFNTLENTLETNQKLKLFVNITWIIDLMFLNTITDSLINYQEENNELEIINALELVNDLKRIKIEMLDDKMFPDALIELKKESQDSHPIYDEKIHEELVNDVKKSIKKYNSKSDKKNS